MKHVLATLALYAVTAVAEIVGCYLILLFTKQPGRWWTAVTATIALVAFGWMLTLHPAASGRVYAAYGGVYIATAIAWLWCIDGIRPDSWDIAGGAFCLIGMGIIYFGPRP